MSAPLDAHLERFEGAKFPLGQLVATRGILAAVTHEEILVGIGRHAVGDWGELCEADRLENERSLTEGARLFSVYRSTAGVKFYIITEWDRSITTALLPEEY